jgi:hypothetical protein
MWHNNTLRAIDARVNVRALVREKGSDQRCYEVAGAVFYSQNRVNVRALVREKGSDQRCYEVAGAVFYSQNRLTH